MCKTDLRTGPKKCCNWPYFGRVMCKTDLRIDPKKCSDRPYFGGVMYKTDLRIEPKKRSDRPYFGRFMCKTVGLILDSVLRISRPKQSQSRCFLGHSKAGNEVQEATQDP